MRLSSSMDSRGPPKSPIYTRTGDKGTTSLYTGARVPKYDPVIVALGDNDELTSAIGLAYEHASLQRERHACILQHLHRIQCCIQDANSNIATPRTAGLARKLGNREDAACRRRNAV